MSARQRPTPDPRIDDRPTRSDRSIRRRPTARAQLTFQYADRRRLQNLIDECNAVVDPSTHVER